MKRALPRIAIALLLTGIVAAHIGLWSDPDIPRAAKLRLTTLNALTWAVILLPAWGVSLWLRAKTRKPD